MEMPDNSKINTEHQDTQRKHKRSFFGGSLNERAKDFLDFRYNTQEEIDKLNEEMTTTEDLDEIMTSRNNNTEDEGFIREKDIKEAESDLGNKLNEIEDPQNIVIDNYTGVKNNIQPNIDNKPENEEEITNNKEEDKEEDKEKIENEERTKNEDESESTNTESIPNENSETPESNDSGEDDKEAKLEGDDFSADLFDNKETKDDESEQNSKFFDPFELDLENYDEEENNNEANTMFDPFGLDEEESNNDKYNDENNLGNEEQDNDEAEETDEQDNDEAEETDEQDNDEAEETDEQDNDEVEEIDEQDNDEIEETDEQDNDEIEETDEQDNDEVEETDEQDNNEIEETDEQDNDEIEETDEQNNDEVEEQDNNPNLESDPNLKSETKKKINSVTGKIITEEEIQLEQGQDTPDSEDNEEYQPSAEEIFEQEPEFFADDELSQQFLHLVQNVRGIFKLENKDGEKDPYFKILGGKTNDTITEYLFYLIEEEDEPVDLYIKKVETDQENEEENEHLVQFSYNEDKELNIFVDEIILYEKINKSDSDSIEYNDTKAILEKFTFLTENHYDKLKSELDKQREEKQKKRQLQQIFKGF